MPKTVVTEAEALRRAQVARKFYSEIRSKGPKDLDEARLSTTRRTRETRNLPDLIAKVAYTLFAR